MSKKKKEEIKEVKEVEEIKEVKEVKEVSKVKSKLEIELFKIEVDKSILEECLKDDEIKRKKLKRRIVKVIEKIYKWFEILKVIKVDDKYLVICLNDDNYFMVELEIKKDEE